MATPDLSIDPRILSSAKEAFLSQGFEKASLKEICEAAGVTTGALYKRYKGKEDLFAALVTETLADLKTVAAQRGELDLPAMPDQKLLQAWEMDEADVLWWFQFLYQRRDGFVLLLKCAAGSSYANFAHEWVEVLTGYSYAFLAELQRRGLADPQVSRQELHILLTAFWTTIYEPFIHDYSWQQIEAHCQIVCKFINWHQALGLCWPG